MAGTMDSKTLLSNTTSSKPGGGFKQPQRLSKLPTVFVTNDVAAGMINESSVEDMRNNVSQLNVLSPFKRG